MGANRKRGFIVGGYRRGKWFMVEEVVVIMVVSVVEGYDFIVLWFIFV